MTLRPTYGHLSGGAPALRRAEWLRCYGDLSVPLKHPLPERRRSEIDPADVREFYLVDVARLTDEQRANVVAFIVERFGVSRAEAIEGLDGEHGLPILAQDVLVSFDARLVL